MHARTRFVHPEPLAIIRAAPAPRRHTLPYRRDVDGLRAVAVLAVLAFHAFPQWVTGGFAGVDVFFVISGYLISGIILSDLHDGQFSFAEFYRRRVIRIFPALALVLVFSVGLGWLILVPADYRQLSEEVAAGAGFVSNLQLWGDSGYFDTSASLKPLLHLWSLGVEEQYYLVWPLLLFMLRHQINRLGLKILLVAAASFVISLFLLKRDASAAFYWPVGRFWELLVGSSIAYGQMRADYAGSLAKRPNSLIDNCLATAGMALIVLSVAILDQQRDFPGFWALLPCTGAGLILQAGRGAWINRHILCNRGMVFVGLISYPLYLWHWPMLVYARILFDEPTPPVRFLILALSGVLAWGTYAFVECKVRRKTPASQRRRILAACLSIMLTIGVAGLLGAANVLPARSASVPRLAEISQAFTDRAYRGDRTLRGDTDKSVLFFGDSHMQQYLPRIELLMREHRAPLRTVVFWTGAGCAPLPGIDRAGRHCEEFVDKGFSLASEPQIQIVVIAASWVGMTERKDYYAPGARSPRRIDLLAPESRWILQGFENRLKALRADGKRVVIVLSSPRGDSFSPRNMVKRNGFDFQVNVPPPVPRSTLVAEVAYIDDPIKQIARRVGAEIVDPMDDLCSASSCPTLDDEGKPLFIDETHLRSTAARTRFFSLDDYVYINPTKAP